MSENTGKNCSSDDRDIRFGIPDTGIRVSWDFTGGCGSSESDKKGTHLRPITPKPVKQSPKVYRRRCLNQIKLPAEGDDAFAEEMLSLVRVSRKSIIRTPPGVSPKGRSPRNLRAKPKPSPLRDDDFRFLLNDSIDNDDMIRCSQLTEAALKEEELESPVAKRVSSAKRLALSRSVASPLSRKKLLDAITSNQKGSPRRPSTPITAAAPANVKTEPKSGEGADHCNNNVQTAFGSVDQVSDNARQVLGNAQQVSDNARLVSDNAPLASGNSRLVSGSAQKISGNARLVSDNAQQLLGNARPVPCNVENVPPQKSPGRNHLPFGVVPITSKPGNSVNALIKTEPEIKLSPGYPADDLLDDGMDFDLELSQDLLALLDGRVEGPGNQRIPKVEPSSEEDVVAYSHGSVQPTIQSRLKPEPPCQTKLTPEKSVSTTVKPGISSAAPKSTITSSSNYSGLQQGGLSLANKSSSAAPSPNNSGPQQGSFSLAHKNSSAAPSSVKQPGPQQGSFSLANKNSSATPSSNLSGPQQGRFSLANKNSSVPTSNHTGPQQGSFSLANKNSSATPSSNLSGPQQGRFSLANKNSSVPTSNHTGPQQGSFSSANKNSSATPSSNNSGPQQGSFSLANKNSSVPTSNHTGPQQGSLSLANNKSSAASSNQPGIRQGSMSLANNSSAVPNRPGQQLGSLSLANKTNPAPASNHAGPQQNRFSLTSKNSVAAPSSAKLPGAQQGAPSLANKINAASSNQQAFRQGVASAPPKSNLVSSLSLSKQPVPKQSPGLAIKRETPSSGETASGAVHPSTTIMRASSAPLRTGQALQPTSKQNLLPIQSKGPARQCTAPEIERKRQDALRKLKLRSQSK